MKYINILLGTFLFIIILQTACSREDELTPSNEEEEYFSVPVTQTDDISQKRRAFYEKTGVHLLFNDTLRRDYVGKNIYGEDIWDIETVDFSYNLTSYSTTEYRYKMLPEEDRLFCVEFVENQVFSHLEKGGQMSPYSILLASSFEMKEGEYSSWEPVTESTVSCMRCLGITVDDLLSMTDDERDAYKIKILIELLVSRFTDSDQRLAGFYQHTNIYYNWMGYSEYIDDHLENWTGNMGDLNDLGFLSYVQGAYGDQFCSRKTDLQDYLEAILTQSQSDFEAKYHDYPLVLSKYHFLRDLIVSLGFKF